MNAGLPLELPWDLTCPFPEYYTNELYQFTCEGSRHACKNYWEGCNEQVVCMFGENPGNLEPEMWHVLEEDSRCWQSFAYMENGKPSCCASHSDTEVTCGKPYVEPYEPEYWPYVPYRSLSGVDPASATPSTFGQRRTQERRSLSKVPTSDAVEFHLL